MTTVCRKRSYDDHVAGWVTEDDRLVGDVHDAHRCHVQQVMDDIVEAAVPTPVHRTVWGQFPHVLTNGYQVIYTNNIRLTYVIVRREEPAFTMTVEIDWISPKGGEPHYYLVFTTGSVREVRAAAEATKDLW